MLALHHSSTLWRKRTCGQMIFVLWRITGGSLASAWYGDHEPSSQSARKYRTWLGEQKLLARQIQRIEEEQKTLAGKRDRASRVAELLRSVETIMNEIAPNWNAEKITPAQANEFKLPLEQGEATRLTLDIMREANGPIRLLTISKRLAERKGFDLEDRELLERIRSAISGTLRSMRKRGRVGCTDAWPAEWFIIDGSRPNQDLEA